MIGNDIIDLELALLERKSQNVRYINKIFSKEEKLQIHNSSSAELCLWQLWSMKETAYKAHQRRFKFNSILNPISYQADTNSGMVKIGEYEYETITEITPKYIHSFIKNDNFKKSIFLNSEVAKDKVLRILAEANNAEKSDIVYEKNKENLPVYKDLRTGNDSPLSLSHHGKFMAIVFPLINS